MVLNDAAVGGASGAPKIAFRALNEFMTIRTIGKSATNV